MKKLLTIAALAALTATSCSFDKEVEVKQDTIGFGTNVGKSNSRAVEENNTDIKDGSSIGIFAKIHPNDLVDNFEANFMSNERLYFDNGWKYDNTKYWPNNGSKISFFAYHPYTAGATNFDVTSVPSIKDGIVSIPFTVNMADPSKQTDLLWAKVKNATKPEGNAPITFAFNHALSKIQFKVKTKGEYKNCKIRVKEVSMTGLVATGTYKYTYAQDMGIWFYENVNLNSSCTPYKSDADGGQVVTKDLEELGTFAANGLLLIPQNHQAATTIKVVYELSYDDIDYKETHTSTHTLTGGKWEQNKVYTYTFNIALDEISFDVEVVDWPKEDINNELKN